MTNFFSSISKKIQGVRQPHFKPGEKVIRAKTVAQVMGPAFNYPATFSATSVFCKKLLKYTITEFSSENLLFLLMCEKYSKQHSPELFNIIYKDFIQPGSPRQLNLSGAKLKPLTTKWNNGEPVTSPTDFKDAMGDARTNLSDTVSRLIGQPFDSAFLLDPAQTKEFDAAMLYLKGHQINLI